MKLVLLAGSSFAMLSAFASADGFFERRASNLRRTVAVLEVGSPVKCNPDPDNNLDKVYRVTEGQILRWYPNPAIATSWDTDWGTTYTTISDCMERSAGGLIGEPMQYNEPAITGALATLTVGRPYKCSPDPFNNGARVYRAMEDQTLRWYPNPPIATSWDSNWGARTIHIRDCTVRYNNGMFGENMPYNEPTVVEGDPVKCRDDDDTRKVYRVMADGNLRWYPNPQIASSWDPNWASSLIYINDCSDREELDPLPYDNEFDIEVGDPVKCTIDPTSNDNRKVYRVVDEVTLRWYPSRAIAASYDPDWSSTIKYIYDCNGWNFADPLPFDEPTVEIGDPLKCEINPDSDDSRKVYRYHEDGTFRWYPNPRIATSWDEDWSRTIVYLYDCTGREFGAPLHYKQGKECTANVWGDPHIVTWDGLKFDAQPKGEAILLTQDDSDLEVQARFEGTPRNSAAVTTGVAIRGNLASHPVVQISMASDPNSGSTIRGCQVELYVDGDLQGTIYHDSTGANGASVAIKNGKKIKIEYPDVLLVEMSVHVFGICYFSYDVTLLDCISDQDTVIGLLGSPDGDASNDWMDKNGTVIDIPHGASAFFFEPAFQYTKENWMLTDEDDSLFDYEPGKSFSDYYEPDEEYNDDLEQLVNNDDENDELDEVCGDDIGCKIDYNVLGKTAALEYNENPACNRTAEFPSGSPTPFPIAPSSDPTEDFFCPEEE